MSRLKITFLSLAILASGGCYASDPNRNPKMRHWMAHQHADRVLAQVGDGLSCFDDYDLMVFWRRHFDEETRVLHDYQLYDVVKTSDRPGLKRFIIAYDTATRKTYLRSELRSNENIDSLPPK